MKCVVCGASWWHHKKMISIKAGNIDNSALYNKIKIMHCKKCGHVFNKISVYDYTNLYVYYRNEYTKYNLKSPNKTGDLPGSSSPSSIARYNAIYNPVKHLMVLNKNNAEILDIGCASGGFLSYLQEEGYKNLYGIDPSSGYTRVAKKNKALKISTGSAEKIPFNKKFDFIFLDQVVEHLLDPNIMFEEVGKKLKPNGRICISVPNALGYRCEFFFEYYWFLMREHIHHFDAYHLKLLAYNNGFNLVSVHTAKTDMLSGIAQLPNLTMVFTRESKYSKPYYYSIAHSLMVRDIIKYYIAHCKQAFKASMLGAKLLYDMKATDVYVYGLSREFLYLYNNTLLRKVNIKKIIDDTPEKRKRTVNGISVVHSRSIIKHLSSTSIIIITAYAHKELLRHRLRELGFKGAILNGL